MKLSNDSAKIASGMVNITEIIVGPSELGMRCFHTRRNLPAPKEREARPNSWSFSCSILPRTILAMYVQPISPIAMLMVTMPGWKTTIARMATTRLGMLSRSSMMRCTTPNAELLSSVIPAEPFPARARSGIPRAVEDVGLCAVAGPSWRWHSPGPGITSVRFGTLATAVEKPRDNCGTGEPSNQALSG